MKLLFIFTFIGIMVFNPPIFNNSEIKTDYNKIVSNNPVSKGQRLFYIERNQDDRIVCYDTKMLQNGKLNLDNPVDVYWLDVCHTGVRSELNYIEQRIAYGYNSEKSASGTVYVTIKAFKKRQILLLTDPKGIVKPILKINNIDAQLTKIYVWAKPRLYTSVVYIEIFGIDVRTGNPVYEKILNQ